MSDIILQTENLSHIYSAGTPFELAAIRDINLSIKKGEITGIIGQTGSGKSTLIQHFNGILKPTSGRILLNGQDIWENKKTIQKTRFKVGLCFQYPEYQLFESTVYKDIAFGPKNMGLNNDEIKKRVEKAAEYVGLKPEQLEKSPFELSGGEKRRAAIAGVMSMEPELLILDEPTAGIDPKGRDMLNSLILDYQKQSGSTVVLVSHNMEDIAKLASSVVVMNNYQIEMQGSVEEVYSNHKKLLSIGLNIPQVTEVFIKLREKGLPVSDKIFTVQEGRKELLKIMKGNV